MKSKTCEGCKHRETSWLDINGIVKEVQCGCSKGFSKILKFDDHELRKFYNLKYNCVWKNVDEPYMNLGYIFILRSSSDIPILHYNIGLIKDKNPTWIGINTPDPEIDKVRQILNPLGIKYTINYNIQELDDYYKIDQFIPNLPVGWTLVNEVKSFFNHNAYNTLIDINFYNPKPAMLIKDGSDSIHYNINNLCFLNDAYRKCYGHTPVFNIDTELFESMTFAQKIEQKTKEKSIFNWSEIK